MAEEVTVDENEKAGLAGLSALKDESEQNDALVSVAVNRRLMSKAGHMQLADVKTLPLAFGLNVGLEIFL